MWHPLCSRGPSRSFTPSEDLGLPHLDAPPSAQVLPKSDHRSRGLHRIVLFPTWISPGSDVTVWESYIISLEVLPPLCFHHFFSLKKYFRQVYKIMVSTMDSSYMHVCHCVLFSDLPMSFPGPSWLSFFPQLLSSTSLPFLLISDSFLLYFSSFPLTMPFPVLRDTQRHTLDFIFHHVCVCVCS